MIPKVISPPGHDEIEISLFGPGYGEAIVIHLGNNVWILIDSCLEPTSQKPAAIHYLETILQKDIDSAVNLIIATHWHDDHIRGLSSIVDNCKSARLVISAALINDEFLKLITSYRLRNVTEMHSGVDEMSKIFDSLESRNNFHGKSNPPMFAVTDRLLYKNNVFLGDHPQPIPIKVSSLSPSDAAILKSKLALGNLLPSLNDQARRICAPSRNQTSVVLWIEVGVHNILLGADVQNETNLHMGWNAILNNKTTVPRTGEVFKIPHHGSINAHEPRVWSELLYPDPYALLTPFRRGNINLPTEDGIKCIKQNTENAFITSLTKLQKHKWEDRVVKDIIQGRTKEIHNVHSGWGQIRLRKKILEKSTSWQVNLFGKAQPLAS